MPSPAQALANELARQNDADYEMCGLSNLTAQQMASNVEGRHVYVECGRVFQGLGHCLKEYGPFDHVIIMTGTNDLGVSADPETITQDVLALHDTCHRAGVRTLILSLHPNIGTNRKVPRCHFYASRWKYLNMTLGQNCWSDDGGDSLTAGFLMIDQRFSPCGEGLSRELGDLDGCVCVA